MGHGVACYLLGDSVEYLWGLPNRPPCQAKSFVKHKVSSPCCINAIPYLVCQASPGLLYLVG
jgi:hypothetical protein